MRGLSYFGLGLVCVIPLLVGGCSGVPEDIDQGTPVSVEASPLVVASKPPGPDNMPRVLTSVIAPNGNTVTFYDADVGVLVTERGRAYIDPTLAAVPKEGADLNATWKLVAPSKPFPKVLADAQSRLGLEHPVPLGAASDGPVPLGASGDAGRGKTGGLFDKGAASSPTGPQAATYYGCNNGCCDPNWLVPLCPTAGSWDWFLFNYTSSWANSGSKAWWVQALVCAATGWSHWTIDIGGSRHYDTYIPEAHYQTFSWIAGFSAFYGTLSRHVGSSVNMDYTPNLHTQCGTYDY